MSNLSLWHKSWQEKFPKESREVRFHVNMENDSRFIPRARIADVFLEDDEIVIEYQHSRITIEEVNTRNKDYNLIRKQVVWVIDCTANKNQPKNISEDDDLWLLEFEKEWHVKSMQNCKILFADFGSLIFRIPILSVRNRMILVQGSWKNDENFVSYLTSHEIPSDTNEIKQSTITVAQDPHGSGKTYRLTQMMINPYIDEYKYSNKYDIFIVIAKSHSAKTVVYTEFKKNLNSSGCIITYDKQYNRQIICKFKRPSEEKSVMCIFGTADSLMYNLSNNRMEGTEYFINIVKTIHKYGPSKLKGSKGRFTYGGEMPRLNGKTLIIVDEATMLAESYIDALSTLMRMCSIDVYLAGDVQQSTYFENNMLTKVITEYNANPKGNLPSFPNSNVKIKVGNEVRRFNQTLVDFRNIIMKDFHENPSHNLKIAIPTVANDVNHSHGEYSVDCIKHNVKANDKSDSDEVQESVEHIMNFLQKDVEKHKLQPNDIIIVSPFVTKNPIVDMLQTKIHEFWYSKLNEPEYAHIFEKYEPQEYSDNLQWLCILHRSEEGKPIDTTESENATRIVSIQASQGDGRRVAYVIGLSEWKLKRFSSFNINIKYESLLNVAISRMKEIIRVFLEPKRDDIWDRFEQFIPKKTQEKVPLELIKSNKFSIDDTEISKLNLEVYNKFKNIVMEVIETETSTNCNDTPVVDYDHHLIRQTAVHSALHTNVILDKVIDSDDKEQILVLYRLVARAKLQSLRSTEYYKAIKYSNSRNNPIIPILDYNTGSASFNDTHAFIKKTFLNSQKIVQGWLSLKDAEDEYTALDPEGMIIIQYALDLMKWGEYSPYLGIVKMDNVYDICNCYNQKSDESNYKLEQHYTYLDHVSKLFALIIEEFGEYSWKIKRSIRLGKKNGCKTQYFNFKAIIQHLLITDQYAVPIVVVPDISIMNISQICKSAILYTLCCLQPEQFKSKEDKGVNTWEFVINKKIKVCFVPLKGSNPIFIDVMDLVEENISHIAEWLSTYLKEQLESDITNILKFVQQYSGTFENLREDINDMYSEHKCLDYVRDAFNDCESSENISEKLKEKLNGHIAQFKRDIESRRK